MIRFVASYLVDVNIVGLQILLASECFKLAVVVLREQANVRFNFAFSLRL